jgi:hypothetical protein
MKLPVTAKILSLCAYIQSLEVERTPTPTDSDEHTVAAEKSPMGLHAFHPSSPTGVLPSGPN